MTEMSAHLPVPYKTTARPGNVIPIKLGSATVGDGEITQINPDGSIEMKMHITDELVAEMLERHTPGSISVRPSWPDGGAVIAPVEAVRDDDTGAQA